MQEPIHIRVKTNVPGGTDPIPSTPEVNENLLAVTGVPEVVDENNADSIVATVPRYENMTEGDKLKLSWGGYCIDEWNQARSNGATSETGWSWTSNSNGLKQYAIIPTMGQTQARSKNTSSIGWGIKAN